MATTHRPGRQERYHHQAASGRRQPVTARPQPFVGSPPTSAQLIALQRLSGNRAVTELVVQREPVTNKELPEELQESSLEGSATHLAHGEKHYYFFGAADPLAAQVTDMRVGWGKVTGTSLDGLEPEDIEALVVRAREAMGERRAAACVKGCERSAFAIFSLLSATMPYEEAAALIVDSVGDKKEKKRTRAMFSPTSPWLLKLAPPEETAGGQRSSKRLRDKPVKEPK